MLSVPEIRFLDLFLHPSEGGLSSPIIIGFPIISMLLQRDHKIAVAPLALCLHRLHLEMLCIVEE